MRMLEWRKAYKFLPKFMQDFHDQKELFKTMHEYYKTEGINRAVPHNPFTNPDGTYSAGETPALTWTQGQCYVIDVFLWFMAAHGYTLQKTRTKLDFYSIDATLKDYEQQRLASFDRMMQETRDENNY